MSLAYFKNYCECNSGARGRTRTGTVLPPRDFKSLASTNFATRACVLSIFHIEIFDWFIAQLTFLMYLTIHCGCFDTNHYQKVSLLWAFFFIWRLGPESNRRTRLCRPLHDHSATQPIFHTLRTWVLAVLPLNSQSSCILQYTPVAHFHGALPKTPLLCCEYIIYKNFGAGNEARTRDLNLGKVALYQLSYSRKTVIL